MAKLKRQSAQPVETPKKNLKVDPLVGLRFTFNRGEPEYGKVEAKISPGVYFVRMAPDYYGMVITASQMSKLDVVFHPNKK